MFARRQRRTLGVSELNEMMLEAQADAYGDGLDQSTAHPYMWLLKPHYYGSHFYNWPYTYGLLFGLGLFAKYRDDPERFRAGYDDVLSRAGMDTAEELGPAFGFDVTDEAFWTASLDVVRGRIDQYDRLAPAPEAEAVAVRCRRIDHVAVRRDARRARRPARRAAALPGRPGVERAVRAPRRARRVDEPAARRCAPSSPSSCRRRSTAVTESVSDNGDTVKFLWELDGGSRIETVLMLYRDRATVCVSSQAGCAMACGFCATGQAGFTRHLTVGEIVEQVVRATRRGPVGRPPRVERRVHGHGRAAGQRGRGVGARSSASTATSACRRATSRSARSGSCPGIRALAARPLPVNLAVSLHAANDELRDELVPINRRYPIDDLIDACTDYLAAQEPPDQLRVGDDRRRQRPRRATPSSSPRCAAGCDRPRTST